MISKNLLHISKLDDFEHFLDKLGIFSESGRIEFEALRIRIGKVWYSVYEPNKGGDHYHTDIELDSLLRMFVGNFKNEYFELEKARNRKPF